MKIFKILSVALFATIISVPAHANDFAVSGVGGSWRPLKGQHRSIRMVRENVKITVYVGYNSEYRAYLPYYEVTADFVFHNLGSATTVSMGFPERGGGANETGESGFKNFTTLVDGRKVSVRRVITKLEKDQVSGDYQALWVKQVPFKRGEKKNVRVSYRAEPGNEADTGDFAPYDFTGGNWRGDVDESLLTVTLTTPCKFLKSTFNGKRLPMRVSKSKYDNYDVIYTARWVNWQAQGKFAMWFTVPKPRP